MAKKKEVKLDETVQGGKYFVNGRWVDANGKPFGQPDAEEVEETTEETQETDPEEE